jgi:cell division transport system permease protein
MKSFHRIWKYGWLGFSRNAWISTAAILTMTLALSVVSGLLVLGNITDTFVKELQGKIDVSVYFKQSAEVAKILQLQYALEAKSEVAGVEYVSQDKALELFRDRHKDNELLMSSLKELNQNPFQASLNIKAQKASQFDAIVSFVEGFENKDIVEKVNYKENEKVIQRLTAITSSIQKVGLVFTIVLAFIVLLVTFNTIRLVIYSYRDEISVMKLVGASDWFIRGPFVVTAALYGVFSAVITWLAFFLIIWLVSEKAGMIFSGTDILGYWAGNFFGIFMILLLLGAGLGVLSAFIAMRRYLQV